MEDNDFGNKHSPIGDDDIASSITLSGQAVIKQSNILAKNYLKEKTNISDDYFKHNDPVVYNDTDSFLGDTEILTTDGKRTVESLWNENNNNIDLSDFGHEMKSLNYLIYTYDNDLKRNQFKETRKIFRHKVKKRLFKIKSADGKEVVITEDHGLMVMRDGELLRISPLEKKRGDQVITTTFD